MSTKEESLQLDLPLVLPDAPTDKDACIQRLLQDLTGRPGLTRAHVLSQQEGPGAVLCVHFDPAVLSLGRVREFVESSGAAITAKYKHLLWQSRNIRHARRARTIADALTKTAGVVEADVGAGGAIRLEYDTTVTSTQKLRNVLKELAIDIEETATRPGQASADSHTHEAGHYRDRDHDGNDDKEHEHTKDAGGGDGHDHAHAHGGILGKNTELYFAILCGGVLGIGYVIERLGVAPSWAPLAFYIAGYIFGGFYTLREAIDNLRLRRFEIDTLMLVAAAGAAALGEWAEGALLLFLFSIGHALENYAMGRARRAIEALAELAPPTAEVRRDGQTIEIPVEELVVGDTVIARPNSRIPADGFVLAGASSVNQAPVTGESVPVDKQAVADAKVATAKSDSLPAENRVFAGTINGAGVLDIYVTRRSADNTLSRVIKMVSEAEAQKSPTQRFTDKFERIFVPVILVFVVLLLFTWVVIDEPFRDSFYRAMAVLVAASPCALAIATPSAVLSGVARAARGGVLVKGGGPLETLGMLNAIAFDKTGTLTEGKPKVMDVMTANGVDEREFLQVAIAVERQSDHPLAAAVVRDLQTKLGPALENYAVSDVKAIIGRGLSATVNGETVHIGKKELFNEVSGNGLSEEMRSTLNILTLRGRTTMIVRKGSKYLGAIGLMDAPRPAAKRVIARLRELGITRMVMLSGDNQLVADAVAHETGLTEARGDLMPEDKVETIKKLRAEQNVAMVGDGVNDAPAMANASVGIAMGAAGSDVALETADVALMADNLDHLPFAVGLSRRTRRVIRQNLWMSLGMVAFLIPATLFGLQIGIAVLFHEGSTLVVVANALRLLAYRDKSSEASSSLPA